MCRQPNSFSKKTLDKNVYSTISNYTAKGSPDKINTLTSLKASVLVATCSTMHPNSGELCDKHSIEVALI